MSEPKAHALYAASSSERWINCPSSLKQIDLAPPKKSGAAAGEGTLAHELMEFALEANIKNVVKFYERDDKYPLQMKKDIQGLVDFVRSVRPEGSELLIEQRVYLDYVHPTEAFGTVDIAVVNEGENLQVIDFKYGRGYVSEKDNPQLMYYAVGIARLYSFDFKTFSTTIYQPRAGGNIVRTETYDIEELGDWEAKFTDAVDLCETATAESDLNAGKWCKFCPAKIICPEAKNASLRDAQLVFADPIQPSPKDLTSNQLKAILDKAAYLKLWLKEVESYAEQRLNDGHKINGWGLTPKRGQRVWNNPKALEKSLWYEDLVDTVLVSPAEAEKRLKELEYDKDTIEDFLKDNVSVVSSGLKLSQTNQDYDVDLLLIEDVD